MARFAFILCFTLLTLAAPVRVMADAPPGPDFEVAKAYTSALLGGNLEKARALSTGQAREVVEKKADLIRQHGPDLPVDHENSYFILVSRTQTGDPDRVRLHVYQNLFRIDVIPPEFRTQYSTLIRRNGVWIVESFEDTQEECCK